MKPVRHSLFLFMFGLLWAFGTQFSYAIEGDTTKVRTHDNVHWNWNGTWSGWGEMPADSVDYRQVLMHYTLGCPNSGCSEWDYSTHIYIRHYTGVMDSNLVLAPDFTVDGQTWDSVCYAFAPTYTSFYDTVNMQTDSSANSAYTIHEFNDPQDPWLATDSTTGYPANYWNYTWNASGMITDSNWVGADTCWYITYDSTYSLFEVTERYEIGRVITPYNGQVGTNWKFTWTFDLTDFEPILHDSVEVLAHYGGWQDGFTITLDFDFIEGTPPREVHQIQNLWNGAFQYGNVNNPIENHLVPTQVPIDQNTVGAKLRIVNTGHSFGGVQNCAEFCRKTHQVVIDGDSIPQELWRYDCGMNPIYPQSGTWIYNRAGWCPGANVEPYDYELTPWLTSGGAMTVDYNMADYTYLGGAGFHPNYEIAGLVFHYGAPNFNLDASVVDIIAPNSNPFYGRFNPICTNPSIKIKNTGATTLTSLDITYGSVGGTQATYTWTGSLAFDETEDVELPLVDLSGGSEFIATVSNPNGSADEYSFNDSYSVKYAKPRVLPNDFYFLIRTNGAVSETKYELRDDQGNLLAQSSPFWSSNTIFRDTFQLNKGCYTFRLYDTGHDGLSFFANNDGSGFARIFEVGGGALYTFEPNFGTQILLDFTVDTELSTDPSVPESRVEVYPNPTEGMATLDLDLTAPVETELRVRTLDGRILYSESLGKVRVKQHQLDLSGFSSGMYLIEIQAGAERLVRKLAVM